MQKFVLNQKDFISVLALLQTICLKKNIVSIMSYILFQINEKELILKASDLEISFQYSFILKFSNIKSVEFLVSGKKIFDILKEMEGDIEFSLTSNKLNIKALTQQIKVDLNIKSAEEFPNFPEKIENILSCNSNFLQEMFNKVSFLIAQNNSNAALNGLLLEFSDNSMKMTTSDGHCLSQIITKKYFLDKNYSWLIPKRAILEIKKILESNPTESIFLGICNNQFVVSSNIFNFFTKLIDAKFPDYTNILNHSLFFPVKTDRISFLKAIRRANSLLSERFLATKFNFEQNILNISLENNEVGCLNEQLEIINNNILEIMFYSPYIVNGLNVFTEKDLNFFLKDSKSPIFFEFNNENYNFTYLVMPVSNN